ncbi:hypothetical protein HS088_TW15G00108 [Tripterygium wilfordii]|uniref:Transcription initiation factor TFIID subunit 2 n=1 Tax=Tripterygium wilfordii TaxID=458696 RepID=A0A7J7CKW7_TRIWF|nr:hypothetical protein HS088_TW15G00108 [Tripterygium wilfordii]
MDHRRIYSYTELDISVPDNGIVGLHAENLGIETVLIDGEPTEFEYHPHLQHGESEKGWDSVSSPIAAGAAYTLALVREMVPNLLINCCKVFKSVPERRGQMHTENGFQSSTEAKQNVKLVRINYWVERAEMGIHFDDNVIHTNNQIRRARCWFPCIDDSSQCCCYDLEFTVAQNLVAVSTGSLLYQAL